MGTSTNRTRAHRIRRKGPRATPAERKWLESYEASKGKRGAVAVSEPVPASAPPASASAILPEPGPPPVPPGHAPVQFPEPDDDDDDDDRPPAKPADGPAPRPEPGHATHAVAAEGEPVPTCGDPSCPQCSKTVGGRLCTATGKIVWNPIDDDAARGLARGLLAAVTLLVKMVRKDSAWIPPTDAEVSQMGRALQKMTYRRINSIGAIDDIVMFVSALGMYGHRAMMTPAPAALPA